MDRTHSDTAIAREVEMNKNWINLAEGVCARRCCFSRPAGLSPPGAETPSKASAARCRAASRWCGSTFRSHCPQCPTGFTIQSPARIALDIPGATNGMGRSTVDINQGNLRSVNVVQAGDRTRLVLNLKSATAYKAQLQGKSLLVVLEPAAAAGPATSAQPVFAESRNRRHPAASGTWISAAAPTARAGSSWTCRTTRLASTSASRARTWWSNSSSPRCPKACAAGST